MKCSICNKEIEESEFIDEVPPLCSTECFVQYFWDEKVKAFNKKTEVNSPIPAIINGTHYMVHPDVPGKTPFRGFGGREFKIRFNDGKEIVTHNLWCQGDIPESHRDKLPDNAVFLQSDEDIKLSSLYKRIKDSLNNK